MAPDFKYILEFSALFNSVPPELNLDMLITPFVHQYSLARVAPPQIEHEYSRCPSPLFFTCTSIISMLTSIAHSGSFPSSIIEIVFLANVSKQYAQHLANQSHALLPSSLDARFHQDGNYKSLTKEERRADALMLRLEAALYPGFGHLHGLGLLGRFIVVIRRRLTVGVLES